ncbi:MAG: hypothetical protein KGH58_01915 [Candidatus Micrarchaeota archaeon]|nr:hypothetical protein [Candidatus Micrarchaeota archaeon]
MLPMIALLAVAFNSGIADATAFGTPVTYPLNVQLGSTYQTVTVGGVCTSGGCTTPTAADIQLVISGGVPPYSIIITDRLGGGATQQLVSTASEGGFYDYQFTPSSVGTYSLNVQVIDSASPSNSQTQTATVVASPQTGSSSGANSASLSTTEATVNVGQTTPITVSIPNNIGQAYTVEVSVNGQLMATSQATTSYTYSFTPQATGQYTIEFLVSDQYGNENSLTASITAVPAGGQGVGTGSGTLTISASPTYKNVAPGTPVEISATASGGDSSLYNLILYDSSGNQVAASQTSSVSYTFTPYQPGLYYLFTAVVYDASHNIASQGIDILTTGTSVSSTGSLSETVTPQSATANAGSSASFSITGTGGLPDNGQYSLVVRDQYGNLLSSVKIPSSTSYTYTQTESAPGTYTFSFELIDSLGNTATQSATLTVASGNTSPPPSSSSSSGSGGLSITVTPPGVTQASPGNPIQIMATASGGDSSLYNIILFDGSGNELAASQTSTLSYTYTTPGTANTYYPISAVVYDASHNIAQQDIDIYTGSGG